jgi:hypothetical protein
VAGLGAGEREWLPREARLETRVDTGDSRRDGGCPVRAVADGEETTMAVMGVSKFEQFFRDVAGLDVDKDDLKRYNEFINHKVYDLLIRGGAAAKSNDRDIIMPYDLPITKGLQESIQKFKRLDQGLELKPILDQLTMRPPLDFGYSVDVEAELPNVVGGLSVALAHTFKIIDPELKNPLSEHWERTFQIFDQLL